MPYRFRIRIPRSSSARSTSGGHSDPAHRPLRTGSSGSPRSRRANSAGEPCRTRASCRRRAPRRADRALLATWTSTAVAPRRDAAQQAAEPERVRSRGDQSVGSAGVLAEQLGQVPRHRSGERVRNERALGLAGRARTCRGSPPAPGPTATPVRAARAGEACDHIAELVDDDSHPQRSACAAPVPATCSASANPAWVATDTAAAGSASANARSSSKRRSRALSGTATASARHAANRPTTSAGTLGATTATRSPGVTGQRGGEAISCRGQLAERSTCAPSCASAT